MQIHFQEIEDTDDALLQFAVVAAKYKGRWIFCRQHSRTTWETPGGHREKGEAILETARRELFKETGTIDFELFPLCVFSVEDAKKTYSMLCFAEIKALGNLPLSEIESISCLMTCRMHSPIPRFSPVFFST